MKQIKVSDATPIQLDWLVAKCKHQFWRKEVVIAAGRVMRMPTSKFHTPRWLEYSKNWNQAGPIIEREEIGFAKYGPNGSWKAVIGETPRGSPFYGPTPLIAVCRCYVASKMGDVVEVPEELT